MGALSSKISEEELVQLAQTAGIDYTPPLGFPSPSNPVVFFDIKLGRYGEGCPVGRITIEVRNSPVLHHCDGDSLSVNCETSALRLKHYPGKTLAMAF